MRRIDGWSLQRRLLGGLLCLLALIALAFYFALATYATRAADRAYDQILLASALSMADGVQAQDGEIAVDLPYASLAILASGRRDRIFYRISAPDGRLVTGYEGLVERAAPAAREPRFVDGNHLGTSVRAVVLGRLVSDPGGPLVTIVVAHSRDERRALAAGIFANAFVPVLLVAFAAGLLIWFAVRRALDPLITIERLVRDRGPDNLEPITAPAPAEVRQLLGTLNQFMGRLQANLALMQTFLADAAHQIRTPLATLRAQADLAVEEGDTALLPAYVRKIHRHAALASQVTNQLLSHTMVAHRGQVATREPVDLLPLLHQVARRAEAGGDSPPLAIEAEGPDGTAVIDGDRITLTEAFTNLIDNAGCYAGRERPVDIKVVTTGSWVEVEVADHGPGIPDEEKARVLERFARGSADRGTVGSGLGLAIVKAVVDSHDGTLALADRPGGGLLVRMAFPRRLSGRRSPGLRPAALAIALALAQPAAAADAEHYPAQTEETARILIHSATDRPAMEPLLHDFQATYPDVAIDFVELQSVEVFASVVGRARGRAPDIAISSAVDLQVKLVNDGWAQRHVSPATFLLPAWANWRDEAFGFTLEPAVIVYARDHLPEAEVPRSRSQLLRLLQAQPDRFRRRIATYDIGVSGLGYLFATQDSILDSQFWPLAIALGGTTARLLATSGEILDAVAAGEVLLGYNVLGSYALARQQAGAPIGIVLPRDYTLWLSRTVLIPRAARDATTAKLFVDHLLSARGQAVLATVPGMRPILRPGSDQADFPPERTASAQPITLGPALLTFLDRMKRERFLAGWTAAVRPP